MHFRYSFIICLFIFSLDLFPQLPSEVSDMGKAPSNWDKQYLKDISNPEGWDETKFEYTKPVLLFGVKATSVQLTFHKNRLFNVYMSLPAGSWETLRSQLDAVYGKAYSLDTLREYPSGSWGEPYKGATVFDSASGSTVIFSDESQKEFRFSDLFSGVLLWVIVTIIGLFVLYYFIAWLFTSWCKGCKTFNMKLQPGVEISNAKDYSTELLGRSMHSDRTYKYKCSKCGSMRKDRYSGFWEYQQKKNQ